MNNLVSIIIPTKNNAKTLAACIQSIQMQTYKKIECIIVDNFSTDQTASIGRSMGCAVYAHGTERCEQRNYGVANAQGTYVMCIDADMELSPHVVESCVQTMEKSPHTAAIFIPEQSFGQGFWARCKQYERSLYIHVPWMNACRFFLKSSFENIGGYDSTCLGAEEYDIHNRIIDRFGKHAITTIEPLIFHNEGALTLHRLWKKKQYYGKGLKAYKAKPYNRKAFQQQSSLIQRIALLASDPLKILHHPHLFAGAVMMKTIEFIAGGIGMIRSTYVRI